MKTHGPDRACDIDSQVDPELRDEIGDPIAVPFAATVVYTPLLVVGCLLALFGQETLPGPLDSGTLWHGLAVGVATGVGLVLVTWVMARWMRTLRALESEFRTTLGPLSGWQMLRLALLSGITEEILFRGTLQPWMGYVFTSVLFGVLHFMPHPVFLPWTVFALVGGFVFGALYDWTGTLLAPIAAHVTVNGLNLWIIVRGPASKASRQPVAHTSLQNVL
ncbi:MAG: CPBP family intramembrane metalloprotease [Planctomycetes bacterium]|nr:CPBP family intramembrane metalloprotease [Planctomycetota bacterium]